MVDAKKFNKLRMAPILILLAHLMAPGVVLADAGDLRNIRRVYDLVNSVQTHAAAGQIGGCSPVSQPYINLSWLPRTLSAERAVEKIVKQGFLWGGPDVLR